MVITPEIINYKKMFGTKNFNDAIDVIFKNIHNDVWKNSPSLYKSITMDLEDVRYQDGIIYLALPGYSKKDIDIDVQGRTLTISAKIEKEDEKNPFRKSFTRKWILADDANTDEIVANMTDGLLSISFGKSFENKKIKIS